MSPADLSRTNWLHAVRFWSSTLAASATSRCLAPGRGPSGQFYARLAVLRVGDDPPVEGSRHQPARGFSDGVFAIAATLLVLEFASATRPGRPRHASSSHLWPSYLAYATSFLTIGIIWMNHHYCVETMARCRPHADVPQPAPAHDRRLPALPDEARRRSTSRAAASRRPSSRTRATFVLMAIIYNIWWRYARGGRRLIRDDVPDSTLRAIIARVQPRRADVRRLLLVALRQPACERRARRSRSRRSTCRRPRCSQR